MHENHPKEWNIPSREYGGVTASEAATMLQQAQEIKDNKPLYKAALKAAKAKKKSLDKIT